MRYFVSIFHFARSKKNMQMQSDRFDLSRKNFKARTLMEFLFQFRAQCSTSADVYRIEME